MRNTSGYRRYSSVFEAAEDREDTGKKINRPNPCLPSDTIVVYISPFIAGTPPVSSSGRGRGSISASLVSLLVVCVWCAVFLFHLSPVSGGVPSCVPPSCREKRPLLLSNPPEGEGSGAVPCSRVCCEIFRCLRNFSCVTLSFRRAASHCGLECSP